jgi:hypothetical protein
MAEHQPVQGTEVLTTMEIPQWASRQPEPVSADVIRFLETHPSLLPVLDDAQLAIPSFLPGATLHYEVFEDPEEGDPCKLALVIETIGEPEVVADRYFDLIREWWLEQLPPIREAILLMVA